MKIESWTNNETGYLEIKINILAIHTTNNLIWVSHPITIRCNTSGSRDSVGTGFSSFEQTPTCWWTHRFSPPELCSSLLLPRPPCVYIDGLENRRYNVLALRTHWHVNVQNILSVKIIPREIISELLIFIRSLLDAEIIQYVINERKIYTISNFV